MKKLKKVIDLYLEQKGLTFAQYLMLGTQKAKSLRLVLVWAAVAYYCCNKEAVKSLLKCKDYNIENDPKDVRSLIGLGDKTLTEDIALFIRIDKSLHPSGRCRNIAHKSNHTFTVSYLDQMKSITTPEERSLAYRGIMEALRWGDKIQKENTLRMIQLHKIRKSWE